MILISIQIGLLAKEIPSSDQWSSTSGSHSWWRLDTTEWDWPSGYLIGEPQSKEIQQPRQASSNTSILMLDQSITCIISTLPLWTSCSSLWCLELECQFCSQLLLCPSQLCSVLRSSCCITSSNNHLLMMSSSTIQSLRLLTRLQFYYCLLDIGF